jgi:hypothetical protein
MGPLGTVATNRPIVPAPDDYDDGVFGAMIGRENQSTRRKLPQCHFVRNKSYMFCSGANPGRCDGKPVSNHLRYSTALGPLT